jgi:hypothetical protein
LPANGRSANASTTTIGWAMAAGGYHPTAPPGGPPDTLP